MTMIIKDGNNQYELKIGEFGNLISIRNNLCHNFESLIFKFDDIVIEDDFCSTNNLDKNHECENECSIVKWTSSDIEIIRKIKPQHIFNFPLFNFDIKVKNKQLLNHNIIFEIECEGPFRVKNEKIKVSPDSNNYVLYYKTSKIIKNRISVIFDLKNYKEEGLNFNVSFCFLKSIFDSIGFLGIGFIVDKDNISLLNSIIALGLKEQNDPNDFDLTRFHTHTLFSTNGQLSNEDIEALTKLPIKCLFSLSDISNQTLKKLKKLDLKIKNIDHITNLKSIFPSFNRKIWITTKDDSLSLILAFYSTAFNYLFVPYLEIKQYIAKLGPPSKIIIAGVHDNAYDEIGYETIEGDFSHLFLLFHTEYLNFKKENYCNIFRDISLYSILNHIVVYDNSNISKQHSFIAATFAKSKGATLIPLNLGDENSLIKNIQKEIHSSASHEDILKKLAKNCTLHLRKNNSPLLLEVLYQYRGSTVTLISQNLTFPLELISYIDDSGRLNTWNTQFSMGRLWLQRINDFSTLISKTIDNSLVTKKKLSALIVHTPLLELPNSELEFVELKKIFDETSINYLSYSENKILKKDLITEMSSKDIFHFAGHCVEDNYEKKLLINNDFFCSADIPKLNCNPLIFLNTCHASENVSDYGKLITNFITNGAVACVATSWNIYDDTAGNVGAEFYKDIFLMSIGTALSRAKYMALQKSGSSDLTPLGYFLFGDPSYSLFPLTDYIIANGCALLSEEFWGQGDIQKAEYFGLKGIKSLQALKEKIQYYIDNDDSKRKLWLWIGKNIDGRLHANNADYYWCLAENCEKNCFFIKAIESYNISSEWYKKTSQYYNQFEDEGYYEPNYFLCWSYYSLSRYFQIKYFTELQNVYFSKASHYLFIAQRTLPDRYTVEEKIIRSENKLLEYMKYLIENDEDIDVNFFDNIEGVDNQYIQKRIEIIKEMLHRC